MNKWAMMITVMLSFSLHSFAETVEYKVGDESFEGYFLSAGAAAPAVLIIHDWDGLTEYEVKRATMLNKMGYTVFAADLFGKGVRPEKVADRQRLTGELYADRDRMRKLMRGGLRAARAEGADVSNMVAMGYCFGGTAVLELARSGEKLKGFAPFHGGFSQFEGQEFSRTKGKVIVFHGTADKHVTMEHFAELAKNLERNGVDHEMISYGGAPHAFSVFGSDRYREDADRKSWQRFTRFLEQNLK